MSDTGHEALIERAIIRDLEAGNLRAHLKCAKDTPVIRQMGMGRGRGRVDLVLFPKDSDHDLVLIEAKHHAAGDAGAHVVGQMLKYYVSVLQMGSEGLAHLRNYAIDHWGDCRKHKWKTWKMLSGANDIGMAHAFLAKGRALKPTKIAMYIALDGDPKEPLDAMRRLLLRKGLPVGVILVRNGGVEVFGPDKDAGLTAPSEGSEV